MYSLAKTCRFMLSSPSHAVSGTTMFRQVAGQHRRRLVTLSRDIYPTEAPPMPLSMPLQREPSIARSESSIATLVRNLRQYLGPKQGINGSDAEVAYLKGLMANCRPGVDEWKRYGSVDPTRSYTRLRVDDINGKCNLLFLVWNAGAESPIHNHADALCIMKIVKGTMNETIFGASTSDRMPVIRDSYYGAGQVAFIRDDIGVHRMRNPNQCDYAVSLHLYTPPHAADYGHYIYDEHTGRSTHMPGRIALAQPPLARIGRAARAG